MTPRVNYLLAACSHRVGRGPGWRDGKWGEGPIFPSKEILRAHVRALAETDTRDLAQVSVIRSLPLVRNGNLIGDTDHYWNIADAQREIKCPVVTLDVKDRCFSYSSWVQAIMKWRTTFDYYVLMEDDYYPAHPRFVEILVEEHKRKLPNGGYLCSFSPGWAAVSNGIVDSATFVKGLDLFADPVVACLGQEAFGRTFCNNQLADYTDKYRCLFPMSDKIIKELHAGSDPSACEDIFNPLEYLVLGEAGVV